MADRFLGKSVLVTGAGSGVGRAAALMFAAEGGQVVVVDRREADAMETARRIQDNGGNVLAVPGDVSRDADCRAMVEAAVAAFGRLDVAFNNAGIDPSGLALDDEEEAAWLPVIDVNLKGIYLAMKHEIAAMLKTRGGAIVNTAAFAGFPGAKGIASYTASRHGVVGLTRSTALDYIGQRIRVNAICPGATRAQILADWLDDPEVEEAFLALHPMGRVAEPEEIARVALFLASDDASFIVGQAIAVDGGLTTA